MKTPTLVSWVYTRVGLANSEYGDITRSYAGMFMLSPRNILRVHQILRRAWEAGDVEDVYIGPVEAINPERGFEQCMASLRECLVAPEGVEG